MNVICFGDSNTYGYDPRSFSTGRYPKGCRWVDILATKTGWDIRNEGVNGQMIPRGSVSFPKETDLLIVMLGTNDLLQGAGAETAAVRMETFLRSLTISKEKICLLAPPPLKLGAWVADMEPITRSVQLAERYQNLARRLGVCFIDAGKWNVAIAFDGVHFTEDGHKAFADGIYKEIVK